MYARVGGVVIEKEVIIRNEVGLHARPAAEFVEVARRFDCDITILCNGNVANAKSMLRVLALGIKKGTVIKLVTDGADEDEALAALCELIEGF
jgi:phosphocarrier protein